MARKTAPQAKAIKINKTKVIAKPVKKALPKAIKAIKAAKPVAKAAKASKRVVAAPVLAKIPSVKLEKSTSLKLTKEASVKLDRKDSKSGDKKSLDLCLLLDCTGSMASWIQRSKDTLSEIITSVKNSNPDLLVRVAFVGYRDLEIAPRFSLHEFTDKVDDVKKFIAGVTAFSGSSPDLPEDV